MCFIIFSIRHKIHNSTNKNAITCSSSTIRLKSVHTIIVETFLKHHLHKNIRLDLTNMFKFKRRNGAGTCGHYETLNSNKVRKQLLTVTAKHFARSAFVKFDLWRTGRGWSDFMWKLRLHWGFPVISADVYVDTNGPAFRMFRNVIVKGDGRCMTGDLVINGIVFGVKWLREAVIFILSWYDWSWNWGCTTAYVYMC